MHKHLFGSHEESFEKLPRLLLALKESSLGIVVNWMHKRNVDDNTMIFCGVDMIKRLMSYPKCKSVEVINNPARPGSNRREVNCIKLQTTNEKELKRTFEM